MGKVRHLGTIPGKRDLYNKLVQYTLHVNQFEKMDQDNCRMEVPRGEMVELRYVFCVSMISFVRVPCHAWYIYWIAD